MLDIKSLQEDLQLALLGEDWKREQQQRARDSGDEARYHSGQIEHHLDKAKQHKQHADSVADPSKRSWHAKQADRHRSWAASHNAMRREFLGITS